MELNAKQIVNGFIQSANLPAADDLESSFLEELVAGFDANPKEARRAMRKLLSHDNSRFFSSACRILKAATEAPGHEYLMKLLLEGDLLQVSLTDPQLFSMETASCLAKLFVRLDPLLDFKLMQLLFRGERIDDGEIDAAKAQRVLDLVTVLPKHTRILPLLLKLLRFSNPRLRSKAVLLFCQVSKNPQWAERQLADEDPWVRASAIEGLWGNDAPGARAVLREATQDPDHRVVANALVGLYLLDGPPVTPQLEEMAAHPAPLFRAAAAYAMGQTLSPDFLPLLSSMVKDYNAKVRCAALRALVQIRKKKANQAEAGTPSPAGSAPEPSADGTLSVEAPPAGAADPPAEQAETISQP